MKQSFGSIASAKQPQLKEKNELFSVFAIVAVFSAVVCTMGIINIKNGYDNKGNSQVFYSQITGATAILGLMATAIAYL